SFIGLTRLGGANSRRAPSAKRKQRASAVELLVFDVGFDGTRDHVAHAAALSNSTADVAAAHLDERHGHVLYAHRPGRIQTECLPHFLGRLHRPIMTWDHYQTG